MSRVMPTKEQISTCEIRKRSGLSCRDCIYDGGRCDRSLREVTPLIYQIPMKNRQKRRRSRKNGYQ